MTPTISFLSKGRAVLAAALLHGDKFRECRGVEVLHPLVAASRCALERFNERVLTRTPLYDCAGVAGRSRVTLFQGDFLARNELITSTHAGSDDGACATVCAAAAADEGSLRRAEEEGSDERRRDPSTFADAAWTDGDLIFANSTCFSKELMVDSRRF